MLELRDIEIISEVAECGSIHLASKRLGISQPALTKRLHSIESRLEIRMFHRQPRGVKLTRLGELFLSRGANLVLHAHDVFETLQRQKKGEEGSFRLGVKPGVHDAFFRESLTEFSVRYPKVRIEIVSRSTPVLCDDVKSGVLDLAIVGLGYTTDGTKDPVIDADLHFEPLFELPLDVVVGKEHPLAVGEIDHDQLLSYPLACPEPPSNMLRNMENAAQRIGVPFDGPRIVIDDYNFILQLVSCSDFWTGVFQANRAEIEKQGQFVCFESADLLPPMTIGIVHRKTWAMPSSVETFIGIMKKLGHAFRL